MVKQGSKGDEVEEERLPAITLKELREQCLRPSAEEIIAALSERGVIEWELARVQVIARKQDELLSSISVAPEGDEGED